VGHKGYGVGCAAADYDNDGFCDLYITNYGPDVLYRNNGDGTFVDVTEKAGVGCNLWATSCAFFDYDNDGYLDLYVVNYIEFDFETNKWYEIRGARTYASPPDQYPGVLFFGEPGVLYRNNGDGTFTDVTKKAGLGFPMPGLAVAVGDYDNDGDMDIYVANDMSQHYLYNNNGDGTFADVSLLAGVGYDEHGVPGSGMGTAFGDYDNNGHLDLIVSNAQNQPAILFGNEGNGFFSDVTYASGIGEKTLSYFKWAVEFIDYDNDGFQDVFIANGHLQDNIQLFYPNVTYEQQNQLFRNEGDGTFTEVTHQSGEGMLKRKSSRGAAFADYDNDGDIDIFINNSNQTAELLRNDGGDNNHWLIIKTVGTRSNRDGIGARIKVVSGSLSQIKEVKSGSSYLSQSDKRVHFGLGKHSKVDLIQIRWPSGLVERIKNVKVDQILTITEGKGAEGFQGNSVGALELKERVFYNAKTQIHNGGRGL